MQAQTSLKRIPTRRAAAERRKRDAIAASRRIGMHTSIAGGVGEALETAHRLRCTTMQIFSASPRMWTDGKPATDAEHAAQFRKRRRELGIHPLVIHANYLINLAAPDAKIRAKSIRGFRGELSRAIALGAEYLVVHPGSRLGSSMDAAIGQIAASIREAAGNLDLGKLRILLEVTAGQGSAVGSRLEEIRGILDAGAAMGLGERLGVCLDTAHLFAAGYDLRNETGLEDTIREIDRVIGLERVRVVHMNDSKAAFGSHVDRHENLGRGHIGLDALGRIVNHPRLAGRAFILETPVDRPGDDWKNVRTLWRLAGVQWNRPAGAASRSPMQRKSKRASGKSRG